MYLRGFCSALFWMFLFIKIFKVEIDSSISWWIVFSPIIFFILFVPKEG